jgi:mRNA-degrading endonuclease RelE of RelBE toxin-antitoxin system
MYQVEIVSEAVGELAGVPVFHRRLLEKLIESKLPFEPGKASRNCKRLEPLVTQFVHEPPLWELRCGEWRIFYDIDDEGKKVTVRAVREKPKGKKTEDIV